MKQAVDEIQGNSKSAQRRKNANPGIRTHAPLLYSHAALIHYAKWSCRFQIVLEQPIELI